MCQALLGGVQKAAHFVCGLAFDAHGHTKSPDFQITDLAIQNLPEKVRCLFPRKRTGTVSSAPDFLDEVSYGHGAIVR